MERTGRGQTPWAREEKEKEENWKVPAFWPRRRWGYVRRAAGDYYTEQVVGDR